MKSLRTRLILFYAAVVTLTVALAAGTGISLTKRQLLGGIDFLLDAEGKEVVSRLQRWMPTSGSAGVAEAVAEHVEMDSELYFFQIHDKSGHVLFRSENIGGHTLPDLTGGPQKRTVRVGSLGTLRVAEYPLPTVDVQIAMSLARFKSFDRLFNGAMLIGLVGIALLSVGVGAALSKFTLRPLHTMQQAASRINATNLSERIPVPQGKDEMAALAQLLNEMFERLERSFNHVKRFTADTAHELLTPLSIIRLHTERLLADPALPPALQQSVEEQHQVIIHLGETLERLLVLSKADANALPLNLKAAEASEFVEQFSEDARLLAESRGLQFVVRQNQPGVVTFGQGWIRQVLFNLLSNAIRVSPAGGTITLDSTIAAGCWRVELTDEGPGVVPEKLEHIFERFMQISPRSEPGGGAGLGLAICKSIVELHRGEIGARNRTDRSGLVIGFTLPVGGTTD
jgi:signal transduction histidine kinase